MTRESGDDGGIERTATSRRRFLKAAGAGALAVGGLSGVTPGATQEFSGIPTPWLHRDGNLIKDPSGNEVILRGFNIADPKRLNVTAPVRGKDATQVIDYGTSNGWHPRVIRVPVQPVDIGEHPPGEGPAPPSFSKSALREYLENHLDPVVDRCEERGVYCIVDYHRHRDVNWATGNARDLQPNEALTNEVTMFWNEVAPRYADRSHVIYEVYNEPVKPGIFADPADRNYQRMKWTQYVEITQPWVDAIRSNADNLTLIGSPSWSQSPEGARVKEHAGEDLAYTYHIYASHTISQDHDWATNNETGEGTSHVYEEVPLFATEFGWQQGIAGWPLMGTTEGFGKPFMEWLNSAPIHWTAWCFDPVWLPSMVKKDFESPNFQDSIGNPYEEDVPVHCESLPCEWAPRPNPHSGAFLKQQLAELRDADVPTADGEGPTPTPTPPDDGGAVEPVMDDRMPTDMDADDHYEDVNGDGELNFNDLVGYYQHKDDPAMTDHVGAYDYTGDGDLDFNDLVALYQEMRG